MEAFDHLHREGGGDEKEALLTYLAFMKGATVKTVDKLFTMVTDNKDPVLLVLGSLAEFTSKQVNVLLLWLMLLLLLFILSIIHHSNLITSSWIGARRNSS